jgi:hypothetical protein
VSNKPVASHAEGAIRGLFGNYTLPDGTPVTPAFTLLVERMRDCTPEWGVAHHGRAGGHDSPPRARDGRDGARPEDRACRFPGPIAGAASTTR